jgi:ElaB/YqjD/DUF883 family membrane-anchored ribosome-binding protein
MNKDSEMHEKLGNLERIRDLLFGEQSRNYEGRFQQLEAELENVRRDMFSRLNELKGAFSSDLNTAIDSIEKKLKYLSATADEEFEDIRQTVERNFQLSTNTLTVAEKNLKSQTTNLQEQFSQMRSLFEQELSTLKNHLLEDLENRYSHLVETKLSRDDLAEILFELCMRVKDTDATPGAMENAESTKGSEGKFLVLEPVPKESGR